VDLLVNERSDLSRIVSKISRVHSENRMAVRNSHRLDPHSSREQPPRQIQLGRDPLQLLTGLLFGRRTLSHVDDERAVLNLCVQRRREADENCDCVWNDATRHVSSRNPGLRPD